MIVLLKYLSGIQWEKRLLKWIYIIDGWIKKELFNQIANDNCFT